MYQNFPNITIFDHPLITHKLSVLRQQETGPKLFRELVNEIAMLMDMKQCAICQRNPCTSKHRSWKQT